MPWLQEARRRTPSDVARYFDCKTCMMKLEPDVRRKDFGCGYLPPWPDAEPWDHDGREESSDERDDLGRLHVPICPGYVCGLPEVVEASSAHLFLKNGGLAQFCDGEPPTPALRDAVTILEAEYGRVIDWISRNPPKER